MAPTGRLERMLAAALPPAEVHEEYLQRVRGYLDFWPRSPRGPRPTGFVVGAALRKSTLFEREYLVVFADDAQFAVVAAGYDACAMDSRMTGPIVCPPAAYVPEHRRPDKTKAFRAILEHELVHVNQALLGRFPRPASTRTEVLTEFACRLRSEYEAVTIEHLRWPPETGRDISVEQTIVLLAYNQAFEHFLDRLIDLDCTAAESRSALSQIADIAKDALVEFDADEDTLVWLAGRIHGWAGRSVERVAARRPQDARHAALAAVRGFADEPMP